MTTTLIIPVLWRKRHKRPPWVALMLAYLISCATLMRGACIGGHPLRYWMMQMFLASRSEGTIFASLEPRQTRQAYIQQVFSSEMRFQHWGRMYVYKSFAPPDARYVVGVVAKEHNVTVAGPPEEAFAAKEIPDWETANVFIDSSGTSDGQKVAMQPVVGNPLNIFRSLADYINARYPDSDWAIAVNPITRTEQFWAVAERFRGHIEEVDLSFAVPNIWGGQSETEKALKELKDQNNAQEVEVKIKNKDGKLNPDSARVRQSVDYITQGGGTARIRDDSDSVIYSSDNEESIVTTPVDPDFPAQSSDAERLQQVIRRLFGA